MCDSGSDTTPHELPVLSTFRPLIGYKGLSEWERAKCRGMLRFHEMAMGSPLPPHGFGLLVDSFVCGASHRGW